MMPQEIAVGRPADFDGRVAFVSGAASGIGEAAALLFARCGARVVVADIDERGGLGTVEAITAEGGTARFVETDVSSGQSVEAAVHKTIDEFGQLDFGINNAGIAVLGRETHELNEDEWDRVMDTNLRGVWLSMKYQIAHMLERGEGCIVNTASIMGLVGAPMRSVYIASKHGVVGLTRAAAVEYGARNIRINAVCPGYVLTPQVAASAEDPEIERRFIAGHPIGRLATPMEVADALVWLCSDRSSFVLGAALPVDGGYTAH